METNETIGSIAGDVRVLMRDVPTKLNPTPHYADDTVFAGIAEGFRRLWAVRPSSRYVDGVLTYQPIPADEKTSVANTAVRFDERWRRGVVYFAAAYCYETGTPDTVNIQMAANYRQQADLVFNS